MLSNKRQITDIVKFLLALLVVNGHLFMYYSGKPDIAQWVNLGAQCVSLFLFFSAYGLMCAYEKKGKDYLKGFFSRRIVKVLIPLVTAYAVSLPVYSVFKGQIDWYNVLTTITWGGPYLKFSWYVTEIVVLYVLFYLSAKLSKSESSLAWILSIAVCLLIVILFVTKQPVWYINGLPCFLFGIWFQRYEKSIATFFSKTACMLIPVLLIAFFVEYQWHYIRDAVPALSAWRYEYLAMYASNFFFVLLAVTIMELLPDSLLKSYRGGQFVKCFYEIYLVQNSIMIMVSSFGLSFGYMWLLTMLATILSGMAMNRINVKIAKLIIK